MRGAVNLILGLKALARKQVSAKAHALHRHGSVSTHNGASPIFEASRDPLQWMPALTIKVAALEAPSTSSIDYDARSSLP